MNQIFVETVEGMDEPGWMGAVEPYVQKVLSELKLDTWEVSLLFCDDPFIQDLNNDYRKIDAPTDILSFENGESYTDAEGNTWIAAGDIIISVPTFTRNAAEFGVSPDEELRRLLIHGCLHLTGRDHGEAHIGADRTFEGGTDEDREMLVLQEQLLAKLTDTIME
ncbi:MAG: rRNA maturation RNase YbeY [Treponemataceae bacterium]|nr:rRNA maturation RNase YbeY [Treponemataceae bacterium]